MDQLRQCDDVSNILLERIVFLGQIQHYPFAVGLVEFRFVGLRIGLFVHMTDVIQSIATHIDFVYAIPKRFELKPKQNKI